MKKTFILGGTGYIANRLILELLNKGHYVKVSYRNKEHLQSSWMSNPKIELVYANTFEKNSLIEAFKDSEVIYYLVHSMESAYYKHLADYELESAKNTLDAALANDVKRIIFLGGLKSSNHKYSKHLRSREEVAELFLQSPLATTVFKAGIIIGAGSAPFEITRKLLTYYPAILMPNTMKNRTQPIAIDNVIYYLVNCLEVPETINQAFDIGGTEIVSFKEILKTMARYMGVRPILIPAPFITPGLSSFGLSIATTVPKPIARSLSSGIISETICQEHNIRELLPQHLISLEEEVQKVMLDWKYLITCDILGKPSHKVFWTKKGDYWWTGPMIFRDHRYIVLKGDLSAVWRIISKIGGKRGYFDANWLWQIRGILNKIMGGGKLFKPPLKMIKGEKFDFWTIYRVKENKELVLWNEMKIPGQATLTYRIQPLRSKNFILHQIVRYYPKGVPGVFNWIFMYGFHQYTLPKMLSKVAELSHAEIVKKGRKNPLISKDGVLTLKQNHCIS